MCEIVGRRKRKKLRELHTDSETEKENVENNPLLKRVPMGLPSAGLSSLCRRLNFKKILASHVFSTPLLFRLPDLAQTMQPLTKPDTVRLVSFQITVFLP